MITALTRAVNELKTRYKLLDEEIVADELKGCIRLKIEGKGHVIGIPPYTAKSRILAMVRPSITKALEIRLARIKQDQLKLL